MNVGQITTTDEYHLISANVAYIALSLSQDDCGMRAWTKNKLGQQDDIL